MLKRIVLGAVFLTACATQTSVTQVWQAQMPPTPPMQRVLVLAMSTDEPMRRTIEDAFVADLTKHGVNATQSYVFFGGNADHPAVDYARKLVGEARYDGILVTRLHGVKEDPRFAEQTGFWDGYYMYGWGYRDAYVVTDEIVTFENTLWDTRVTSNKLVWTAETKTTNPESGKDFAKSLTKAVDPALARSHFIPTAP